MKRCAAQTRESERRPQIVARSRPSRKEEGYILLTLLLVVSLMAILALAVVTPIKFEVQRDREQEMIHRGVQYTRAIRGYYKKFGRYPTRLEDLENTNNLRYLRKRYKDPLNKNQDFRLLHFGEQGVNLTLAGGIPGGNIPGANPIGQPNGLNSGPSGPGFGSGTGGSSSLNPNSGFGNSGVNSFGVFAQSSGPGGNSTNSNSQPTSGQPGANPPSDQDPSQQVTPVPGQAKGDTSSSSQQVVIGGPIVGVASISKNATIREYNKKKKYNEWQFVYDPALDRGGLITTPYQPSLQNSMIQPGLNPAGQNGQPGSFSGSSFGQPSSFGNSQNPGAPPPPPPTTNPPQPQ